MIPSRSMAFRDESDALRARAQAAEVRAKEVERERERLALELVAAREGDVRDAERIAELERRIAKLEPGRSRRSRKALLVGAALGTLAAVGAVAAWMTDDQVAATPRGTVPHGPLPFPVPSTEPPVPPTEPPVSPLERVRLAGVVRSTEGVRGLAAGHGCVVDRGLGGGTLDGLQIRCLAAGRIITLFDEAEPTESGMTAVEGDVREARSSAGVVRVASFHLRGTWSGPQSQIVLDPAQRSAHVWSSRRRVPDVQLEIESAAAGPGVPVTDTDLRALVGRSAVARLVLQRDQSSLTSLGYVETDDCTMRTEPIVGGAQAARLLVKCGERVLYGARPLGLVEAVAEGAVLGMVEDDRMTDQDGDPAMAYGDGMLHLVDHGWRGVFSVEPHPACALAGGWIGQVRGPEGDLRGASLDEGVLSIEGGGTLEGEPDMRCHEGVARWLGTDGEPLLEGRFGPGFATFVGQLGSGELLELYRQHR